MEQKIYSYTCIYMKKQLLLKQMNLYAYQRNDLFNQFQKPISKRKKKKKKRVSFIERDILLKLSNLNVFDHLQYLMKMIFRCWNWGSLIVYIQFLSMLCYLSIYLSIPLCLHLSIYLSHYACIYLSIYPIMLASIYLSMYIQKVIDR